MLIVILKDNKQNLKELKMIKPSYQRIKKVRKYNNVLILLRELFKIPNDEIIIKFE